jgi:threonine aldolase
MIDLRSDTLTLPDLPMLETILTAKLGDNGRLDEQGRGEDSATNELEDLAASLTGKEKALLFSSGTLANTTALLTWCEPGDMVMVDPLLHLYITEQTPFDKRFGQLIPVFYQFDDHNTPDPADIERVLKAKAIKLLCLENSHNYTGGTCTPPEKMREIQKLARDAGAAVHLDGARLFNAAGALGVDPKEICRHADSVMFCLSKGLGAPIGSLLCGSADFIRRALNTRRMLGASMRQCGVIAAPGIYALKHNIERLKEDADNAKYAAALLEGLKKAEAQKDVQTNIVNIDVSRSGLKAREYAGLLKKEGLLALPVSGNFIRLVFYKGITRQDAEEAAAIFRKLDQEPVALVDFLHSHAKNPD